MHRFVAVGTLVLALSAAAFAGQGWSGGPEYFQLSTASHGDTQQLAIDSAGNIFIADASARCIRKWPAAGGATSIVAGIQNQSGFTGDGGSATSAKLNNPHGIAVDSAGNLYIADTGNHRIRKVDTAGVISTIAGTGTAGFNGDGTATTRQLNSPRGVSVDATGNIWIADTSNHRIRRLSGTTLTTFAGTGTSGFDGDGVAVNKRLNGPYGVYASGTDVLIADTSNNRIRKLDAAGDIATIAGGGSSTNNDAPATNALLNAPRAVCRDAAGFVFIANTGANKVLRVDTEGLITNLSFDAGTADPSGIVTNAANRLFFSAAAAVRKCRTASLPVIVTGPAANPNPVSATGRYHVAFGYDSKGNLTSRAVSGGATETFTYQSLGLLSGNLLTQSTLSGAGALNFTYEDTGKLAGLRKTESNADGVTTYTRAPATGFVSSIIDKRGKTWTVTDRNDFGQPTELQSPGGKMLTKSYNPLGQCVASTDLLGYTTRYRYDERGRLTETFGTTVTKTYDNRGRVTSVAQPNGTVSFTYNADGSLKEKLFGGTTLQYNYNTTTGRMTGITHKDGGGGTLGAAAFGHDSLGRINSYALPNDVTRSLTFDAAGRTLGMTQTVSGAAENFSFGYDAAGRLVTLNKGGGGSYAVAFTYDAAGRLVSEKRTGVGQYVQNYNYDANDNRTGQTTVIGGEIVEHVLNFGAATPEVSPVTGSWNIAAGTLNASKPDTNQESARVNVNVGANALLPLSVKVQPDIGDITTSVSSFSAITFGEQGDSSRYAAGLYVIKQTEGGVDYLKRQLRVLWIDAAGVAEVIGAAPPRAYSGEQLTLSYELVNGDIAVTVVEDGVGVPPLLVEPAHSTGGVVGLELRGPQDVELFTQFDDFTWRTATGGTVVKGWTYNNLNQLTAINEGGNTETFEYDALGLGLMARRKVNNVVTAEYTYDRFDRLTGVVNGANNSAYTYAGASWMRNSATVNGAVTNFVYDGSKVVVTQAVGGVATQYLGLWERAGSTNLTHAIDGMGNITGLVGAAGYTQKFNFDAWGNFTATDGAGDPIAKTAGPRYRGYQYDSATDQYATGWRPYVPGLGRFASFDPMGTPDGPNRYNYCNSQPNGRSDPSGTTIEVAGQTLDGFDISALQDQLATSQQQQVLRHFHLSPTLYRFNSNAELLAFARQRAGGSSLDTVLTVQSNPSIVVTAPVKAGFYGAKGAADTAMQMFAATALWAANGARADAHTIEALYGSRTSPLISAVGREQDAGGSHYYSSTVAGEMISAPFLAPIHAAQDFSSGNAEGAIANTAMTALTFTGQPLMRGSQTLRLGNSLAQRGVLCLEANPRANPFNYVEVQPSFGSLGGDIRLGYVNPKRAAIEGALEADGLRIVSGKTHGNSLLATGAHDVYAVRVKGTGQILHIGETGNHVMRFARHRRVFEKLGIDVDIQVLRTVEGKDAARQLEARYISTFRKLFGDHSLPFNFGDH